MNDSLSQFWATPIHDQLPLLSLNLFGMTLWSWFVLFLFFSAGWILKKILTRQLSRLQTQLRLQPGSFRSFLVQEPIASPVAWILIVAFWRVVLGASALPDAVESSLAKLLLVLFSVQFLLLLYRASDGFGKYLDRWAQKTGNPLNYQLVPFAIKTLKIVVVVLGGLIALQNMGINVASILAGIGIGSLALALAAQDTAANLFGSVMIILDRPFKVGDVIRVVDVEGTVEEVGFRSTRLRTAGNSLVTIPNSTMAKEKIDNLGERPSRRLNHVLGFEYGTSRESLNQFMESIRYFLAKHEKVVSADTLVALIALADFSLQIRVTFFVRVSSAAEELKAQQEFLMECLRLADELRISYAFPTQTIHVQKENS